MSGPSKNTAAAGVIISALVVAAVGSIGYFQFQIAPGLYSSTTMSTSSGLPPSKWANVTIPNGAAVPPSGYTSGAVTHYGFLPDSITVVVGKNNTINWFNNDTATHTATLDNQNPGICQGPCDTGYIAAGASAQLTLITPGTYTYRCSIHPYMQGTIKVLSG